jgi:hypothetical protein
LSDSFPIQNGLKQGDALSPLLLNFALEYTIRKVQETQMGLKVNATHQLLDYADDMNLLGDNIYAIKKNTVTFTDASREAMLLSRRQNAGQNRDIKIANRSFEYVSQFKYLGTTITYQNVIQEKIKRRLNSGNACYHLVANLLSSHLLSKNIKINIYRTINLTVVLYGCETCSLTLRTNTDGWCLRTGC